MGDRVRAVSLLGGRLEGVVGELEGLSEVLYRRLGQVRGGGAGLSGGEARSALRVMGLSGRVCRQLGLLLVESGLEEELAEGAGGGGG